MTYRSLAAAGLSAALCLSSASPALALTTEESTPGSDDIVAQQVSLLEAQNDDACAGREGTQRGRCIADLIKRIKRLRDEFKDALELERTEWYAANAYLGVSEAYSTALQNYTKEVSAKRKLFNEQQRSIEKIFFSKQKEVRSQGDKDGVGFSRPVTKNDLSNAEAKCSKQKDKRGLRICMRQQLRLNDPNAKQMGAGLRTERSQ